MKIPAKIPSELLAKIPPFPAGKVWEMQSKTKLLLLKTDTKNPLLHRIDKLR